MLAIAGMPTTAGMLDMTSTAVGTAETAELQIELGTEFRSEKILGNRLRMVSVIPRKKVLIPRYSEFRGRANSKARNGPDFREKIKFYGAV